MAYIGRQLTQGNFIKLDDLQSQFDGSKTTFSLTAGGQTYKPGSSNALLVSLGGVIQEAGSAFTLNNDEITFSNPPTADANIFIIALGNSVSVGTPADNTVTQRQLSDNLGEYSGIGTIILSGIVSATSIKIGSAITFSQSGIDVTGVVTATSFKGDGSNLTGITNATTVTIADESSDTTCFPLFATAATGDLAPKSGTNLTFNSSSGALTATSFVGSGANLTGVASTENIRTNTNATFLQNVNVSGTTTAAGNINVSGANITLQDSGGASDDRLTFGIGADLSIYHDGTHSYITNDTNDLAIECTTSDAAIVLKANSIHLKDENNQSFIKGIENTGAVELYYGNSKKFETSNAGAEITGKLFCDGLDMDDDEKILLGTGDDLEVYHNGSHNFIDSQNGRIYLRHGTDNAIYTMPNAGVRLFYDDNQKLETTNTGVTVTGTVAATSYTGDGSALTGIGGTANVRTGILDVAGIATFRSDVNVPNINGGQIGGRRNLVINGAMEVAQRGDATGVTASYGGCDRFRFDRDGATAVSLTQATGTAFNGFPKAQRVNVTTADTSMGSANYNILSTRFEGQNLQMIRKGTNGAKELTLSFYIKSTVTGTYIVELYDHDNNRQCSKAYTISSSNTWEKKEITFPADTTGTFDFDANRSMGLNWWLGAGSDYAGGTLNTSWASATNANRAVGQVNAVNSTSNDIYLTGVQLELGSQATAFEHRTYPEELILCKRYFNMISRTDQTSGDDAIVAHGFYFTSTRFMAPLRFDVPLRTESFSLYKVVGSGYFTIYNNGSGSHSVGDIGGLNSQASVQSAHLNITDVSSSGAAGVFFCNNSSARLGFDDEL